MPLLSDLGMGQFGAVILALLIASWMALKEGRNILGGILLGVILAIKLFAWPIIIFLLIIRQIRAVVAAGIVVIISNLAASLIIGMDRVFYYYTSLSSQLFMMYRANQSNFSLFTVGWRFFEGTAASELSNLVVPPLIPSPVLAKIVWIGLPLIVLCITLWFSWRINDFDMAFAALVILSILLSPISWNHYFSIAIFSFVILLKRLFILDFPTFETCLTVILGALLVYPAVYINLLLNKLTVSGDGNIKLIPFWGSLITLTPLFFAILLIWIIFRTSLLKKT